MLKPICIELKVHDLIASKADAKTGRFLGENCKGTEKVKRLKNKYSDLKVRAMYTDSYSDQPLIDLAIGSYIVRGNDINKIK